jgi:hypothetical protein
MHVCIILRVHVQVLGLKVQEEQRLREGADEAIRKQQREHGERIVESNQKSARLTADLAAAQITLDSLKKQVGR